VTEMKSDLPNLPKIFPSFLVPVDAGRPDGRLGIFEGILGCIFWGLFGCVFGGRFWGSIGGKYWGSVDWRRIGRRSTFAPVKLLIVGAGTVAGALRRPEGELGGDRSELEVTCGKVCHTFARHIHPDTAPRPLALSCLLRLPS